MDLTVTPGVVFLPIHWNELWGESASPNEATSDAHDPISKQPSLKYCPVAVTAADAEPAAAPAAAAAELKAGGPANQPAAVG